MRHKLESAGTGSSPTDAAPGSDPWWLRRQGGLLTLMGDGVRVLVGALCVAAALTGPWSSTALWALVALGVTLFRARDLPPVLDLAGSLTLVAAAWAAVADAYARYPYLDQVLHFASGAVLAGLVVQLFGARSAAPWRDVVRHALVAVALAYVWELLEWGGHTFVDRRIYIAYADTMTDIAATGLGGAAAGLLAAFAGAERGTRNGPAS